MLMQNNVGPASQTVYQHYTNIGERVFLLVLFTIILTFALFIMNFYNIKLHILRKLVLLAVSKIYGLPYYLRNFIYKL